MDTCAPMSIPTEPRRVRFAPSPTGALHIGGARTALYNWLAAAGWGGAMLLRIEDTDRERSTPENVDQIIDALRWLELDWDGEPISQYERRDRHAEAVERLLESGRAYHDPSTGDEVASGRRRNGNRGYRGEARRRARARPRACACPDEGATVVHDLLRGDVAFPNDSQDDFVIARGDGTPLYNLAVAVDDHEMGITDVIRGDDHLSNTPKQAMVLEALGHRSARATSTCPCSTGRTARSSPSATARRRFRSCATPATCRRRFATTWRSWAGEPTTTRRSCPQRSSSSASTSRASAGLRRSSTSRSSAG